MNHGNVNYHIGSEEGGGTGNGRNAMCERMHALLGCYNYTMNAIFLEDWGKAAAAMLNKREFDRFCGLFVRFAIGEELTEEDEQTRAFKLFKSLKIDEKVIKSLQKYEQKCERIRQKQDKNKEKNITQNADTQTTLLGNTNTNTIPNTNTITNTILKEKDKKESAGKPPRPTLEEVKEYVKEKQYNFDPEAFFNFYESNGWKVGKNPMKSWRAACATWQKRHNEFNNPKSNNHGRDNNDHFSGTGYTGDTI